MNPSFDRERGLDHVMHALKFLIDEGCLIAIMSAGTEFRETIKAVAIRALRDRMNAQWRALHCRGWHQRQSRHRQVWKNGRRHSY